MKMSSERRGFGAVGFQVALGIVAVICLAHRADARQPSSSNQSDTNRWRDDRSNDFRGNRAPPPSAPRYSAPARDYSPPPVRTYRQETPQFRAYQQEKPRSWDAGRSIGAQRQPTTVLQQRTSTFDTRRSLAAADDRSGADRSRRNADSVQPQPRSVQRDNPPPTRSDNSAATRTIERQGPPPRTDAGGSKTTETRARFDKKIDTSGSTPASRAGSSNVGRKIDGASASGAGGGTGGRSTVTGASSEGRTRASDVRRRFEGRTSTSDAVKTDRGVGNTKPTTRDSVTPRDIKSVLGDSQRAGDVKKLDRRDDSVKRATRDITLPKDIAKPKGVTPKDGKSGTVIDTKRLPTERGGTPTKQLARDVRPPRFSEQVKSGKLNHLAAGEAAKKVHLAEQYKMYAKGDVARRLDLDKHAARNAAAARAANLARFEHHDVRHYVHHPKFHHHGLVIPTYHTNCLVFNYWGPSFFVGPCWYPHWTPWVSWSWHHHHHIFWDPRPVWCRPIIYQPAPVWVYYNVPVWTPLPEVESGTWVDLKPPVMAEAVSDLQLLAVRFVDPGHPEEKLGPRYRVWFRNNGNQPIARPFNVMLFAANDDRLAANLPQAGVRVTAIEANDIQSVDIRLPIDVLAMNRDAQGKPSPFSTLHAMVDANREVPEADRANNGVRLLPAQVLPVDPAAFELDPVSAKPGGEVILAGEGLGPEPGQLLVHVNGKELQGEILGWYDLGIRWRLPQNAVAAPTEAEVIVIRGDGAATNPLKMTINP